MTFQPLLSAPPPIPYHALAALAAAVLGGAQLAMRKGTATHRRVGYVWCALMAFVAASGFFIYEINMFGPFSPIHLLSLITLVLLWRAVALARRGDIPRHRRAMKMLFWLALIVTGAFTFFPGRVMFQVVTGT